MQQDRATEHHELELSGLRAQLQDTHAHLSAAHTSELETAASDHASAILALSAEHSNQLGEANERAKAKEAELEGLQGTVQALKEELQVLKDGEGGKVEQAELLKQAQEHTERLEKQLEEALIREKKMEEDRKEEEGKRGKEVEDELESLRSVSLIAKSLQWIALRVCVSHSSVSIGVSREGLIAHTRI